jgi:hypothetical protein
VKKKKAGFKGERFYQKVFCVEKLLKAPKVNRKNDLKKPFLQKSNLEKVTYKARVGPLKKHEKK